MISYQKLIGKLIYLNLVTKNDSFRIINKKIVLLILTASTLISCTNINLKSGLMEVTIPNRLDNIICTQSQQIINFPIPIPPKKYNIDWHTVLSPMIKHMLEFKEINNNGVLLINKLKNTTNGNVQAIRATAVLTYLILSTNKFRMVDADKLNKARQKLGLSSEDSLETCSKAIGLSRYLKAKYMLYSSANGDVKTPIVDLRLILVETGEIVWSDTILVRN